MVLPLNWKPDYQAHTMVCVDLGAEGFPVTTAGLKAIDAHVTDLEKAFVFLPRYSPPPVVSEGNYSMRTAFPALDYTTVHLGGDRVLSAAGMPTRLGAVGNGHYFGKNGDSLVFNIPDNTFESLWSFATTVNGTGESGGAGTTTSNGRHALIQGFSREGDTSLYFLKLDEAGTVYYLDLTEEKLFVDGNNDYLAMANSVWRPKGSFCYGVSLSQTRQVDPSALTDGLTRFGEDFADYFDCDLSLWGHQVFYAGDRIVVLGGQERRYGGWHSSGSIPAGNQAHVTEDFYWNTHISCLGSADYPDDATAAASMRCTDPELTAYDNLTCINIPDRSALEGTTYHNVGTFPWRNPASMGGWDFRRYNVAQTGFWAPNNAGGLIPTRLISPAAILSAQSYLPGTTVVATTNPRYANAAPASGRLKQDFQRGSPWVMECRTNSTYTDAVDRLQHYDETFSSAFALKRFPCQNVSGGVGKVPQRMSMATIADGRTLLIGGYYPCAGHVFQDYAEGYSHDVGWGSSSGGSTGNFGTSWNPGPLAYRSFVSDVNTTTSVSGEVLLFSGGYLSTMSGMGTVPVRTTIGGFSASTASSHVWISKNNLVGATDELPIEFLCNLKTPRFGAAVIAISDTEVLVCGGFSSIPQSIAGIAAAEPVTSIEVIDVTTGISRLVGDMEYPRAFHTANIAGDFLLLVGGDVAAYTVGDFNEYNTTVNVSGDYHATNPTTGDTLYGTYEVIRLSDMTNVYSRTVPYGPRKMHTTTRIENDGAVMRFLVYVGVIGWERLGLMVPFPVRDYGSMPRPVDAEGAGNSPCFEPDFVNYDHGENAVYGHDYSTYGGGVSSAGTKGRAVYNILPYIINLDFS